jgi:hypothetical protein
MIAFRANKTWLEDEHAAILARLGYRSVLVSNTVLLELY